MNELMIEAVWRIDHAKTGRRRDDEALGLFLQLRGVSFGVRVDIDNSGQKVEVRAETLAGTLSDFRQNVWEVMSRAGSGTALAGLAGRVIRNIHFAYVDYAEKPGPHYTFNDAALIGLQIEFADRSVLTFYNQGDAGKIEFNRPLTPPLLVDGDETWKPQPGLIDFLRAESNQI